MARWVHNPLFLFFFYLLFCLSILYICPGFFFLGVTWLAGQIFKDYCAYVRAKKISSIRALIDLKVIETIV